MPACCSVSITARVASGDLVGFSREVPSIDPPSRCTRDTSSIASGRSPDGSRRTRCLNPSRMPMTSKPWLIASMVAAEMTALMPGAGPPPTRMPSRFPAFMDARILSAPRHGVNRKRSRDMIWRPSEGSRMRFRSPLLAIAATPLALALTTTPLLGQDSCAPADAGRRRRRLPRRARSRHRPDGTWVAYAVGLPDVVRDKDEGDIWLSNWAGTEHVRLTSSPTRESQPRFSPDGKSIAFVSGRKSGDDDKTTGGQIWLLSRQGGEARRLTTRKGGAGDVQLVARFGTAGLRRRRPRPRGGQDRRRTRRRRSRSSSIATASSAIARATWSTAGRISTC